MWHEVVVEGAGQPGADKVENAVWIETQAVTNEHLVRALRRELDAGEAKAIALALEIGAELLLMDERLGRGTARHPGPSFIGLIGVLVEARYKDLNRTPPS